MTYLIVLIALLQSSSVSSITDNGFSVKPAPARHARKAGECRIGDETNTPRDVAMAEVAAGRPFTGAYLEVNDCSWHAGKNPRDSEPKAPQKLHAHSRVTPSIASKARHGGMGVRLTARTKGSPVAACELGTADCLPYMVEGEKPPKAAHHWSEWRCAGCGKVETKPTLSAMHCFVAAGAGTPMREVPCERPPKPHRWARLANYEGPQIEADICLEHGETRVREWK